MRRACSTLLMLILPLISLVAGEPVHAWQRPSNLLKNPGREGGFFPWSGMNTDPTGNGKPGADTVAWSGAYVFFDRWGQLDAVAHIDVIAVFMCAEPNLPVRHNDTYWDDAVLMAPGQGGERVQPPPTATPAGPPTPTATCAPAPPNWVTYYVQRGDTLYSLARRSGTTVNMVMAVNCLHTTTIHRGLPLLLPRQPDTPTPPRETSTPTPVPPTATSKPTGTPTAAPSKTPTVTPAEEPTETPTRPAPTVPPATATPVPEVAATATVTKPPPTIPPPATSTPGSPTSPPTATPSGGGTRPCGTIYVGAGIVLLAGVFRFRRRRVQVKT